MITSPGAAPHPTTGRADADAPDLTDYRVVHRAMTVDADRLATVAAALVERPDPRRLAELRRHLRLMLGEIEHHHRVEDEHVWPAVADAVGDRAVLARLTTDHEELDAVMRRATGLAAHDHSTAGLVEVLRELAGLLSRHIHDEEREIFPLILRHLSRADYERIKARFRGDLHPRLLPFVVPWVVGHATADERRALVADAGLSLRIVLALFERSFRARQARLFGPPGGVGVNRCGSAGWPGGPGRR